MKNLTPEEKLDIEKWRVQQQAREIEDLKQQLDSKRNPCSEANDMLLPNTIWCPFCNTMLELDEGERKEGILICPVCENTIRQSELPKMEPNEEEKTTEWKLCTDEVLASIDPHPHCDQNRTHPLTWGCLIFFFIPFVIFLLSTLIGSCDTRTERSPSYQSTYKPKSIPSSYITGINFTRSTANNIIAKEAQYYTSRYGEAVWDGGNGQEGLKHMYVEKLREYLRSTNPRTEDEALPGIFMMNQLLREQVKTQYY